MVDFDEFGWVLIYVFAFGISDYFVKKYIKTDLAYILYYLLIGFIGLFILFRNLNLLIINPNK